MSSAAKDYSLHLIGLGGAGTNVLEAFLRNPKLFDFLRKRGVKITFLALDVADHDVMRLQHAYEDFAEELKSRGIPMDKVQFNARSVKFSTPQAMFEFIQRYPDFIKQEGAVVPKNYKPWLTSAVEIPPLAGGVGRRRALSKAIYGLNYYYLRLIDTYTENFKESVSSSILQPIIFVIFGIGGGSGSGMAVDFVRHLRRKIGSGFPIIGFGILPCSGDDQRAKGASAYASLNELEMFIDNGKNKVLRETYGEAYANPFTAFIMMPLGPPFRKAGSLADAQKFFDESVVDIILNALKFDLADMLDGIGANLNYDGRPLHIAAALRITYPILDYIQLTKLYLEKLAKLRVHRRERREILSGAAEKGFSGIEGILNLCYADLAEVYKQLLIRRRAYQPGRDAELVREFIYSDKAVDYSLKLMVKGLEVAIRESVDEVMRPIRAIGLEAPEATPEARLRYHLSQIIELTRNIAQTYHTYHEDVSKLIDEMNSNVIATQKLTFREKTLLNDFLDVIALVDRYLSVLKTYVETKVFGDKLVNELSIGDVTEWHDKLRNFVQTIIDVELKFVNTTLSTLFSPAKSELSAIESYNSEVKSLRKVLSEEISEAASRRDQLVSEVKKLEAELSAMAREAGRLGVRLFSPGKKRELEERIVAVKHSIGERETARKEAEAQIARLEGRMKEYAVMERRTDLDSEYRKLLWELVDITNRHYEKLSDITREKGYYDRKMDITEEERLKIMEKILREEEDTLTRETILKEIVDLKRFREYLIGAIRILQIPSTLGLEESYKTDYVWLTVVAPPGIWDQELDAELKATLAGYLAGSASRTINIAHIESEDPWTIRLFLVASKARKSDLDIYNEMRTLYEQASDSERLLAHSLLLEQGVLVVEGQLADEVHKMLTRIEKSREVYGST